ncbi:MAG: hypothetical protein IID36_07260 [Planctomycetes bacterium]|nr:hypothetical protein [Planctomycetota bacterium]
MCLFLIALLALVSVCLADPQDSGLRMDEQGHQARATVRHVLLELAGSDGEGSANGVDWVALGPFGGDIDDVAVSPTDPNIVLAGLAPAGASGGTLFASIDGGAFWSEVMALSGISVFDIEFTPAGTAYIGTMDGVWRSTDDGSTWTQLDLGIGVNDQVFEVAINPNNSSEIWAGVADALGSQPNNVMRSMDGGETWQNVTPPMGGPLSCQGITFDPNDSNKVYAAFGGGFGGGGVWFSANAGTSWVNRSAGVPNNPMTDIVHDGARVLLSGGKLFGSQFVGLYSSADDGATWTALHDESWPSLVIHDIDIDSNDAHVIYVASAGSGVFRTTDGGDTWVFFFGGTGSLSLNSVRFAPGDSHRILLGASSVGVLQSTDAGGSFPQSSVGIGALNVVSAAAHPNDEAHLAIAFQGLNDGGVFSSINSGKNWFLEPLPPTRYNTVLFSPDGTLYALSDGPSTIAPEGLYRRNGDGTWTGLGPDQGAQFESRLFAMRFSQNDEGLIMLGGSDFGVAGFEPTIWRSTDAGASWTKVHEGPKDFEDVTDIEIIEDGSDMTMLASYSDFGTNPQDGGVLRSSDGGLSWSDSSTGLAAQTQAFDLCASPTDPNMLFLADGDVGPGLGGVFVTTDAGLTWASTGTTGRTLDVVCDPTDDQVLYITNASDPKVLVSSDQGQTFAPFDSGLAIAGQVRDLAFADGAAPRLLLASSTGTFAVLSGCAASIVSVDPPSGTEDARQPHDPGPDCLVALGIGSEDEPIVFELSASGVSAGCFSLCETEPHPVLGANSIESVVEDPPGTYTMLLDHAIAPGAWTTISLGAESIAYLAMPANANGDGISNANDVLALIDMFNNIVPFPFGPYSTDIDRSGVFAPADILREIDLLNGAIPYRVWNGVPKPQNTCP